MNNICYWYEVAFSTSLEGLRFKEQHPEIRFDQCINKCFGYNTHCKNYTRHEMNEIETENLVNRIEDFESELNSNEDYIRFGGSYASK